MRLAPGMLIKTSYGSGPYRIKAIRRGCTCPNALDMINNPNSASRTAPHIHLVCVLASGSTNTEYYLNQYDEEKLMAIWPPYDTIEIIPNDNPVQMELL